MTTFRKGDRVELTVEVTRVVDDRVYIEIPGAPIDPRFDDYLFANQIAAGRLLPRAIGVGDRVRWNLSDGLAVVKFIDGKEAWITIDGNEGNTTVFLSELTPAPEEK
jgi:hypothetical protein